MTRDGLIMAWLEADVALDAAKEEEMRLRLQLVSTIWPASTEGTYSLELGRGYELKMAQRYNYTLDEKEVPAALENLARNSRVSDTTLVNSVIRWKPLLRLEAWRELTQPQKAAFAPCLTIKPGTPSLEFVEPKVKT